MPDDADSTSDIYVRVWRWPIDQGVRPVRLADAPTLPLGSGDGRLPKACVGVVRHADRIAGDARRR
ncbi:MAG: hypothetical protein C4343_00420 [Chloroflexota bacterium]